MGAKSRSPMKINKIVAIDVETTGYANSPDVTLNHQIVSIGLVIANKEFVELDKFYCEIKHNGSSHWSNSAERIHGLSKAHLAEHGISEEDAVVAIVEFLTSHINPEEPIFFLGHNTRSFDIPFFVKLMTKYDIHFKIAHRAIDSFGVGFACFGLEDSEAIFSLFYSKRKAHNALEDARMALGVCRKVRKVMQALTHE